jgi:hypothetical protein
MLLRECSKAQLKQQFMNCLFETQILLSRFLVIYRVYRQCRFPRSFQSQIIDEMIGPGLINPRNTYCVNSFVQLLFHILPLTLMIVAWPNRDPIILALRLVFVAMSQNRPTDAVSLSIVCEPDVLDSKYCVELALQISRPLTDASSGMFRGTSKQLFCFRQITRFSIAFSSRCVSDPVLFFFIPFRLRTSPLTECLNSYFRVILLDAEPP